MVPNTDHGGRNLAATIIVALAVVGVVSLIVSS